MMARTCDYNHLHHHLMHLVNFTDIRTCILSDPNTPPCLYVAVEDKTSLVLDLGNGYIYFNYEYKREKLILTYSKFDSNLFKRSETKLVFDSYAQFLSRIVNIITYNANKKR